MFVKNYTGNMLINVDKITRIYILPPSEEGKDCRVVSDVGDGISNTLKTGTQESCERYLDWFMTLFGIQ